MKKRLLSILITAVMVVTSLPVMAFGEDEGATESPTVYFQFAGIDITDDNKSDITAALKAENPGVTGNAAYDSNTSTLTLNNFKLAFNGKYEDEEFRRNDQSYCIDSNIPLNIVVQGDVTLTGFSDPIHIFVHNDPDFDAPGDVSIAGNGKLSLIAGEHTNDLCEGIAVTLDLGDINISCRELFFDGYQRSVDLDAYYSHITSKTIKSTNTGEDTNSLHLNSKTTLFDGCENVLIKSSGRGIFQDVAEDHIEIRNCGNFNIESVYEAFHLYGNLLVNNSTVVAKSGYSCVKLKDTELYDGSFFGGELIVQGEQSNVYIKAGDKEIEPEPSLNPYDKIYGVYVDNEDNEDNKGISISGGTLKITGSEGALYSENGEFGLDLPEGFEALGTTEEETFKNLKELTLTDNTAKVDDQVAKSVVCKMNCEYENSKLKEIIADLKTQIANLKSQIEELTAQLNKKPDILIPPAKPAMSVKAGKRKLTVSWNAVSGASGYQIYYKKKGASAKTITTTAKSRTIKKLSKKKKYTVKVRAYKTSGSTITYGSWSSARTIKTK